MQARHTIAGQLRTLMDFFPGRSHASLTWLVVVPILLTIADGFWLRYAVELRFDFSELLDHRLYLALTTPFTALLYASAIALLVSAWTTPNERRPPCRVLVVASWLYGLIVASGFAVVDLALSVVFEPNQSVVGFVASALAFVVATGEVALLLLAFALLDRWVRFLTPALVVLIVYYGKTLHRVGDTVNQADEPFYTALIGGPNAAFRLGLQGSTEAIPMIPIASFVLGGLGLLAIAALVRPPQALAGLVGDTRDG